MTMSVWEEVVEVSPGRWVNVSGTSPADLDRQIADLLAEAPLEHTGPDHA